MAIIMKIYFNSLSLRVLLMHGLHFMGKKTGANHENYGFTLVNRFMTVR